MQNESKNKFLSAEFKKHQQVPRLGIAVGLLMSCVGLTSCTMEANIRDLNRTNVIKSASLEGVASSQQFQKTTSRQHLVHSSTGSRTPHIVIQSTTRGYVLFQGVQGQLISEDPR